MFRNFQNTAARKLAGVAIAATLVSGAWAASPTVEKAVDANKPATQPLNVVEAKAKAQTGQKVVVQGKVKDFIAGNAVFTLADVNMKSCKDKGEDCPTPWDYCCETKESISKNSATVMLVAKAGEKKPVKEEIKGVKGIDHLTPVAVEGVAQKDKAGNLVVYAEKIHVTK